MSFSDKQMEALVETIGTLQVRNKELVAANESLNSQLIASEKVRVRLANMTDTLTSEINNSVPKSSVLLLVDLHKKISNLLMTVYPELDNRGFENGTYSLDSSFLEETREALNESSKIIEGITVSPSKEEDQSTPRYDLPTED